MFELTILGKDGRELKRYELSGSKPIKVGRAIDCDIKIAVPQVSRRHATIEQVDDNEWVFTDLDSTHGSYVNGERIKEQQIESGLEVVIGPAVLRFENLAHRIGREINDMLESEMGTENPSNMDSSIEGVTVAEELEETLPETGEASVQPASKERKAGKFAGLRLGFKKVR